MTFGIKKNVVVYSSEIVWDTLDRGENGQARMYE